MPTFTSDWFSYAIPNFEAIHRHTGAVSRILEIGVYQGRATCWMLQHMLADNGTMVCVDPFCDADLTPWTAEAVTAAAAYNADRLALFRTNTAELRGPSQTLDVRIGRSYRALAELIEESQQFDFVYVDGNHSAATVMADCVMAFGMLKPGGIMLIDDYLWDHDPDWLLRPKMAVDAFVNMFQPQSRQIISNYQLAIQRTK